jgi:hypothetical protein
MLLHGDEWHDGKFTLFFVKDKFLQLMMMQMFEDEYKTLHMWWNE